MKTTIKIIFYGLVAELLLSQAAMLLALKQPSVTSAFCAGFSALTVFALTYLLLRNLAEVQFSHYHIVCPPLEKPKAGGRVPVVKEHEPDLLFRPTFMR